MKERPSAKQKQTVGAKTEDCLGFKDDVSRQTWFYMLVPVPTDVISEFVATLFCRGFWFVVLVCCVCLAQMHLAGQLGVQRPSLYTMYSLTLLYQRTIQLRYVFFFTF